jgi:hypothetical protein
MLLNGETPDGLLINGLCLNPGTIGVANHASVGSLPIAS